jgi:hypothetical protein
MERHIRKIILVIITLIVLSAAEGVSAEKVTKSQQGETSKREVVRRVAHQWVQVGQEQYKRGYYEQARQSYLMAMDYQDYLTDAEKGKINKLLEETKAAAPERKRILERIRQANELVEQGELVKARTYLEEIANNKFLNEQEKKQIVAGIGQIESQLNEGKKEVMGVYNRSVEYFKSGQLEKAREGFLKVAGNNLIEAPAGRTPEDYLMEIDGMLMRKAEQQMSQETGASPEPEMVQKPNVKVSVTKLLPEDIKPEPNAPEATDAGRVKEPVKIKEPNTVQTIQKGGEISTQLGSPKPEAKVVRVKAAQKQKSAGLVAVAEPGTGKNREAEKTDHRKNVIRSYVKAVVGNALSKAQNCIGGGDFARAQEIIDAAVRTVGENRSNLGDELFKQYSGQLEQLRDRITKEKKKWLGT